MLKRHDPNPLNFFEVRRASIPCPYFEYVSIPLKYNLEQSLVKWITENLKGRYYIGKAVVLSADGQMETAVKVGFEEPKECSYFTLACPYLKYN